MCTANKVEEFEVMFIRLLHILAHHPDLENLNEEVPRNESSEDGDAGTTATHERDHETLMSLAKSGALTRSRSAHADGCAAGTSSSS
jgi:hypothetical protein